jgi:glycosyltransferase involved in cell wall biosynthesis
MIDLSVVIPNRNSPFLTKTIKDILGKAETNIEVIINVDENWSEDIVDDDRVHYIHPTSPRGMRAGINAGVRMSQGKYILKCDDHVMFSQGFDKQLIDVHQTGWVQIPRRYALNVEEWKIEERTDNKYPIDYMYIDFPRKGKAHDDGMHGVPWKRVTDKDETPSMQGSCYFMERRHFTDFLGGLSEVGYGQFSQESQEIGFKTWLGGGAVMVNKNAWYAHLHKGSRYGKMYKISDWNRYTKLCSEWSADYWLNNRWEGRKHDFSWFINEKFSDMPGWSSNWEEEIRQMGWIQEVCPYETV